ncbi:MAG: 3-oxoacyl-ACP synthase III family protein [Candidatus Thorarchaeota archaeon]
MKSATIIGTGSYLPPIKVTNKDLEKKFDTSNEWINTKLGIKERRRATSKQATSDLAINAIQDALKNANLVPNDLDLIICSRHVGDYSHPATACLIQHKIGAKNAAAFDMQSGCSGFIFSVPTASSFINLGTYKNIAVVNVCLHSKYLNMEQRWNAAVFGDGAGAVILGPTEKNKGILSYFLKSDGSGFDLLCKPGGGTRTPITHEVLDNKELLYGVSSTEKNRKVFDFAVNVFPKSIKEALAKTNLTIEDIDIIISHQANINIIKKGMENLGLPMDKTFTTVHKYGNCAEASIPITLSEAVKEKRIKKNDIVAFTGFGAGLSWGSIIMKWTKGSQT